jgi:hypothetical protein
MNAQIDLIYILDYYKTEYVISRRGHIRAKLLSTGHSMNIKDNLEYYVQFNMCHIIRHIFWPQGLLYDV